MAGVVRTDLSSEHKVNFTELDRDLDPELIDHYVQEIKSGARLHFNSSIDDNAIDDILTKYRGNYSKVLSQDNLFLDFDSYSYVTDEAIRKIAFLSPNLKKINLKSCVGIQGH
jgi:hypothetical protein